MFRLAEVRAVVGVSFCALSAMLAWAAVEASGGGSVSGTRLGWVVAVFVALAVGILTAALAVAASPAQGVRRPSRGALAVVVASAALSAAPAGYVALAFSPWWAPVVAGLVCTIGAGAAAAARNTGRVRASWGGGVLVAAVAAWALVPVGAGVLEARATERQAVATISDAMAAVRAWEAAGATAYVPSASARDPAVWPVSSENGTFTLDVVLPSGQRATLVQGLRSNLLDPATQTDPGTCSEADVTLAADAPAGSSRSCDKFIGPVAKVVVTTSPDTRPSVGPGDVTGTFVIYADLDSQTWVRLTGDLADPADQAIRPAPDTKGPVEEFLADLVAFDAAGFSAQERYAATR